MEPPVGAFELATGAWIDPAQLRFAFARSSGPGGQAVNKVSTQAQLRVSVEAINGLADAARDRLRRLAGARLVKGDELLLVSKEHRSQLANRRACIRRFRALVGEALIGPKPRKPTRPTRGSVERRLTDKRRRSKKKDSRRRPPRE